MMFRILGFLSVLFIFSCSNLSKNIVKEGDLIIKSGRLGDRAWSDSMQFQRRSWYQELTLVYDFSFIRLSPESPFQSWFSEFEKTEMAKCPDFILALTYALDSRKISNHMFVEQMRVNGYEKMALPNFNSHLRLHPEFEAMSMNLYEFYGLCSTAGKKDEIVLHFPGFEDVKIH